MSLYPCVVGQFLPVSCVSLSNSCEASQPRQVHPAHLPSDLKHCKHKHCSPPLGGLQRPVIVPWVDQYMAAVLGTTSRLTTAGAQARLARPRPAVGRAAVQRVRSKPAMARRLAVQPQASAKLHDFCMSIPYGAIVAIGGLASLFFGTQTLGWQIAGSGAAVCAASAISLSSWKKGSSSAPFTVVSAGVASWLAYTSWQRLQTGSAALPWYGLLALSAALVLFCVYNLLAGGNPPSKKSGSSDGDVLVAAS